MALMQIYSEYVKQEKIEQLHQKLIYLQVKEVVTRLETIFHGAEEWTAFEAYKLPEEFKIKWLEALRSGEIAQAHQHLHTVESGSVAMCCLGVAYNCVFPDGWKRGTYVVWGSDGKRVSVSIEEFYPATRTLIEVQEVDSLDSTVISGLQDELLNYDEIAALGLDDDYNTFFKLQDLFSDINDSNRFNFEDIAWVAEVLIG